MAKLGDKVIHKESGHTYYIVAMSADGGVFGVATNKESSMYELTGNRYDFAIVPKEKRPRYRDWEFA